MDQGIAIVIGALIGAIISGVIAYLISEANLKAVERTANSAIELQSKTLIADLERTGQEISAKIGVEVLSKNRQEWINNLRNDVSKLMSLVHSAPVIIASAPKNSHEKNSFISNLFIDIQMTTYHIELLLNPSKPKHIELTKAIYNFVVFFDRTFIKYEKEMTSDYISVNTYLLLDHLKPVKRITQEILKTEWERVKKGV